jgi:hypothetical protein
MQQVGKIELLIVTVGGMYSYQYAYKRHFKPRSSLCLFLHRHLPFIENKCDLSDAPLQGVTSPHLGFGGQLH